MTISEEQNSNTQVGAIPKHLAIIMDGNGRWAKARGLPRIEGHRAGAQTVRTVVEESRRLGIRYLTLYTFSSENWSRPEKEVSGLMQLFVYYLEREVKTLIKNGVRLRAIGELDRLPAKVKKSLDRVLAISEKETGLDLILAISYGSRNEIVSAVKKIAAKVESCECKLEEIDHKLVSESMYAPDVPDPDLLIRTSGECRISNFLLWQLAYSEIVISPKFWPEFDKQEFFRCLQEFSQRERRFGLTGEQVSLPNSYENNGI